MKSHISDVFRQIQLKTRYSAIGKIYSHLTADEKLTLVSLARSCDGCYLLPSRMELRYCQEF